MASKHISYKVISYHFYDKMKWS